MQRRHFLKRLALGASMFGVTCKSNAGAPTPSEIEGPFYPVVPQKDRDADLTRVAGKTGMARGEIIELAGQVLSHHGTPIAGVTLELWQANAFGKYHHPRDDSPQPLDEHFQAWSVIKADEKGNFRIKTVMPGAYTLPANEGTRTPHIHFKVSKNGYKPLLTQMYFPGQALNDSDPLIKRRTPQETARMTAASVTVPPGQPPRYRWNICLMSI